MYEQFYSLKENPFNITSDPDFYFSSSRHAEAISHLEFGIQERKGIVLMTGEIGTGKTTLCRTLLNRLDKTVKTALILNPSFSELQLLRFIIKDFGLEIKARNKFDIINALNEFLIREASFGNNVVLIIDEAQNLRPKQLEQVRLLSNLETEKQKLLQVILVGQPELLVKLRDPSLRQLNQRISVRYHILPLDRTDIQNYIDHRLKIAQNGQTPNPSVHFTEEAISTLYELSNGIPRMLNILCDRALLAGFSAETFTIDERMLRKCFEEVTA